MNITGCAHFSFHNQSPPPCLTIDLPLLVEQDALYRSPDQHITACLLNDRDDVKGKLTGAPSWVVCTTLVVVKKESVDEKAGLFRRDTLKKMT